MKRLPTIGRIRIPRIVAAWTWGLAALAGAETFRVLPGEPPQAALDRAGPGDTVLLSPGTHRGRLRFRRGGEFGRPVVLAGEPGAVLDASEPFEPRWESADDVAPGVHSCRVPFEPFVVCVDGRIVTMLREDRVDPTRVNNPAWHVGTLFDKGVGRTGWKGVRALAMYRRTKGDLLLKFGDGADPADRKISFTPLEPAVLISGVDRCVVRDLAIRRAAYGVYAEHTVGSVVENCTIGPADYGIWLDAGSYKCTVRFNDIFLDAFGVTDTWQDGSWDNWQAHKTGGFHDRFGVEIHRTAGGHRVHDNRIHDTWDGIEDRGGPGENVGLDIHHNLLENLHDDGLEPNGAEEDCRWHDNVVVNAICGFRIKEPTIGPLFAYRNIFFRNKEDFRNFGSTPEPAAVFVYHNTSTAGTAIQSNKVSERGVPGYRYFNNLFHCRRWWGNTGNSPEPDWQADFNVYCFRGTDPDAPAADRQRALDRGCDANSLWTADDPGFADPDGRDVSLTAASPARGRGADLAERLGRELPGAPAGARPDAGALQYGEPMPVLPRAREAVDCPDAGSWPVAGDRPPLPWKGDNLLPNGGFEEGLSGWQGGAADLNELREEAPFAGTRFLRVQRGDAGSGELQRVLEGLVPGRRYVLVYRSRNCSVGDFRVIVRELKGGQYLSQGKGNPGPEWRLNTLSFVCPPDPPRLEISPRTPGNCDLDGIELFEAR